MQKIRLLIVDDHEVVRLGLKTLLNDETDLEVIAEAGSAEAAIIQVGMSKPDVVILDIQLPGRSGLEVCKEITRKFPNSKVIILTSHGGDNFIEQAIRAGASGYILKQVGNEELIRAIRAVYRGEMALDPKTSARVIAQLDKLSRQNEQNAFSELSPREMDVLMLVSKGESNKEVGKVLNLTETTVRNYISNMLEKLHLRNRIELATFAIANHLSEYMDRK
jgi:DNA-binding NarL/FixJ family response regulator